MINIMRKCWPSISLKWKIHMWQIRCYFHFLYILVSIGKLNSTEYGIFYVPISAEECVVSSRICHTCLPFFLCNWCIFLPCSRRKILTITYLVKRLKHKFSLKLSISTQICHYLLLQPKYSVCLFSRNERYI